MAYSIQCNENKVEEPAPCPTATPRSCCLDGVLPQGEVDVFLPLLEGLLLCLELANVRLNIHPSRQKSVRTGVSLRRIARVFLGRRSRGLYFFVL